MKSATFRGFGRTGEGTPLLAFDIEMADGQDLNGRIHYSIAAIRDPDIDDNAALALITPDDDRIATIPWTDRVHEAFARIIDQGGYIAGMNYANLDWDGADGAALPVLSSIDERFDHTERVYLDNGDIAALKGIRDFFIDDPDPGVAAAGRPP